MKNFIIFGAVIVGILAIYFFGDFSINNKEEQEFINFQQFLNDEFFPVSKDCFDHFNQAVDELYAFTFSEWYFIEDGSEENINLQETLQQVEDNVLLNEVKTDQSIELKKNILNQIVSLKETLQLLYNAPTEDDQQSFEQFRLKFISMVDELSIEMEEMNTLFETNSQNTLEVR
ncbi:hypothetical protein SAMN05880501_10493 [Ureibacillus xyleni]|uniref:Uncharacterized protein n=1 Tax=Ureibacillus xyleni TaxID=614648 RepID=A0A285SCZ2_9BACL|nr:hypothetical protein [Ureibacillus xyleni]SOC05663.1 hypothetical protein SAMN05880501_10493 [Ureibacillus xyleni]